MYSKPQTTTTAKYAAPDCCVCESAVMSVLCGSGYIEDWIYDENGI